MFRLPGPDPGRGGVGSSLPKAKVAYSAIWGRGQLSPFNQVAGSKGVASQQCRLCAGHPPSAMRAVSHLEERIPPLPLQGCFAYAPLGKEEFYCGCTEELSQELALWLVDPSVERQASQMQHIAKPGSSVEHCCRAEQGSEKELKSFFF